MVTQFLVVHFDTYIASSAAAIKALASVSFAHEVATPMLAVTLPVPPKGFSLSMESLTCSASTAASGPERFGRMMQNSSPARSVQSAPVIDDF